MTHELKCVCLRLPLLLYKCTKHQFIHSLTATFKDLTKGDIARITLTVCQCAVE